MDPVSRGRTGAVLVGAYGRTDHPVRIRADPCQRRSPLVTAPPIQIAVDAHDPHALARFWAAVVGYEVEDHHDMIGEVIAAGYATLDDTIEIDGRRSWATAAACRD